MKKKFLTACILCILLSVTSVLHADSVKAQSDAGSRASISVGTAVPRSAAVLSAGANTVSIKNGASITAAETTSPAVYQSQTLSQSGTLTYKIVVPHDGALELSYAAAAGGTAYAYLYKGAETTSMNYTSFNAAEGVTSRYYTCTAGTYKLEFKVYPKTGYNSALIFSVVSTATGKTIPTNDKIYACGHTGNNTTSTFKIIVPSTGYLKLAIGDISGSKYPANVYAKTKGFSDFVSFNSSGNISYVGVKKGTYTFTVKTYTPIYGVKATFKKVKESKYGKKKSKAVTLKKKKTVKGLLITNSKKAHWYKFKLKKNQKVTLNFKTALCGSGSYTGGLKYTLYASYDTGSGTIYDGVRKLPYKPYTIGMKPKLKRGTYYLKIESYNGGTGYYTIKWK